MTLPPHLELLQRLGNAPNSVEQKQFLRSIKTEIIGHIEKKEQIVRHGVLDILKRILVNVDRARGKRGQQETNGSAEGRQQKVKWNLEEDVRLQALLLLGSLANAGPSFLCAIGASNIFPHLLSALSPTLNPPKTIVAALKAILAISDAETAADYCSYTSLTPQCRSLPRLYTLRTVRSMAEIFAQRSTQQPTLTQVELAARLIKVTCDKDLYRNMLLDGGVLDLLAAQLASHFVRLEPWTNWDERRQGPSPATDLPPPGQEVSHILGALAAIVGRSRYRAIRLACSPTVNNIFSLSPPDTIERHRSIAGTAQFYELPRIPSPMRKNDEKNYPSLSSSNQSTSAAETSHLDNLDDTSEDGPRRDACQSSLVTWLITMVKTHHDLCRVEAANLVVLLCLSMAFQVENPRMFSHIIIPCLIQVVDEYCARPCTTPDQMRTMEQAMTVLATLIKPDHQLQTAAIGAGAVTRVCTVLRATFRPMDVLSSHWSPSRLPDDLASLPLSCRVTALAIPPDVVHAFKLRESALYLLGAVAATDDSPKKTFTESGMITVIKDCMEPLSKEALATMEELVRGSKTDKLLVKELGNPVPVLIAACNAGRVLARSVNLLRTSLIDAGMAAPTFNLVANADAEVVKAATDFACNLNPEFSPIREDLVKAGIVTTLCANSQSSDSELCFRSLWALKHLIYQSPLEVKLTILEKLGTGRLKQMITSDASLEAKVQFQEAIQQGTILDETGQRRPGHKSASIPGLDDPAGDDELEGMEVQDTHRCSFNDHGDIIALDLLGYVGPRIPSEALRAKVYEAFSQDRSLAFDKFMQTAQSLQHHSLDIIRNFIMGPKAADTIEFITSRMQDPDIFDMVAEKIQTHRPANLATTKAVAPDCTVTDAPLTSGDDESSASQSSKLLHAAVMILTHVAAGSPAQRQDLISHRPLMKLMLSLLGHSDGNIRISVVFCISNLTWIDDDADRRAAVRRAQDLKELGFVEALEARQSDDNLDVRERMYTAKTQLYDLLGLDHPAQFNGRGELRDADGRRRALRT